MTTSLLKKTRKINMLLQRAGGDPVNLNSLAEILSDNIDANCYIVNEQGKILGYYLVDHMETAALKPENSDVIS
jgi:transcriptional pleiotropic repressor